MTRKLCSLLISSFAVLLLMGAGVEEDSAALVDESGSEYRQQPPRWRRRNRQSLHPLCPGRVCCPRWKRWIPL